MNFMLGVIVGVTAVWLCVMVSVFAAATYALVTDQPWGGATPIIIGAVIGVAFTLVVGAVAERELKR